MHSINEVVDIYRRRSDNNYFIKIAFPIIKHKYFGLQKNNYQNICKKLILGIRVNNGITIAQKDILTNLSTFLCITDYISVIPYEIYLFLQIHNSKSQIFMKFDMLGELIEKNLIETNLEL